MLDIKNPVQAYEVFKLQWMIEHGATLSDLVRNLQLMLDEDLDGSDIPTSLQSLFLIGNLDLASMVLFGHATRSSWSTIIP